MWDNIYQPDQTGSEGGLIISDEEYKDSCRITLEKCERYYAITCGIYGGMMHTVFCNSTQYQETYNNMKKDLQEFIDRNTSDEEEIERTVPVVEAIVSRFDVPVSVDTY